MKKFLFLLVLFVIPFAIATPDKLFILNVGSSGGASNDTLQSVTDRGSTTTNSITASSFNGAMNWVNLQNYPASCSAGQGISALGDSVTCSSFGSISMTTTAGHMLYSPTVSTINSTGYDRRRYVVTDFGDIGGLNNWVFNKVNNPWYNNYLTNRKWNISLTMTDASNVSTTYTDSDISFLFNGEETAQAPVNQRTAINGKWELFINFNSGQNYNTGVRSNWVGCWIVKHYYNAKSSAVNMTIAKLGSGTTTVEMEDWSLLYGKTGSATYSRTVWGYCTDSLFIYNTDNVTITAYNDGGTQTAQINEVYFFPASLGIADQGSSYTKYATNLGYTDMVFQNDTPIFQRNVLGNGVYKAIHLDTTDGRIGLGTTTNAPAYPIDIRYNISGYSIYLPNGNIGAKGFITLTDVDDRENVLETFEAPETLFKTNGEIDHKAFGRSAFCWNETDLSRPVKVIKYNDVEYIDDNGVPRTERIPYEDTEYPYKVESCGVDIVKESASLRTALYELNQAFNLSDNIVDTTTIMAEAVYTKSKVPEPNVNYCKMIMEADIYDKATHYAYKNVSGRLVLDSEQRDVVLEGCEKQKLQELCVESNNKYSWCSKK